MLFLSSESFGRGMLPPFGNHQRSCIHAARRGIVCCGDPSATCKIGLQKNCRTKAMETLQTVWMPLSGDVESRIFQSQIASLWWYFGAAMPRKLQLSARPSNGKSLFAYSVVLKRALPGEKGSPRTGRVIHREASTTLEINIAFKNRQPHYHSSSSFIPSSAHSSFCI